MDRIKEVEELSQTIEDALLRLGLIMYQEKNETFRQNYETTYKINTPTLQALLDVVIKTNHIQ